MTQFPCKSPPQLWAFHTNIAFESAAELVATLGSHKQANSLHLESQMIGSYQGGATTQHTGAFPVCLWLGQIQWKVTGNIVLNRVLYGKPILSINGLINIISVNYLGSDSPSRT